jgi:hypothetical protein
MKNIKLIIVLTLFSMAAAHSQEIRTKVNESTFDLKPDAVKEEELDEATTFVFAGAGYGRRTGKITTGFIANSTDLPVIYYPSTTDKSPFVNGVSIDLGFRHFFSNQFGIGLRTGLFANTSPFVEQFDASKKANQETYIYQGTLEGLYRYFLSSGKSSFVYGSLGLGWSYLNQVQKYRYSTTELEEGFFALRPAIGINLPVWDVLHVYAETGYLFSQGNTTNGDLSLSQFQISAGVQIRLNSF